MHTHSLSKKVTGNILITKIKMRPDTTISPILLKILDTFYVRDIQRKMLVLENFFFWSSVTLYRWLCMFTFLLPLV